MVCLQPKQGCVCAPGMRSNVCYRRRNHLNSFLNQWPFEVLFEDDHLLLINKPPSLVVHPGSGHTNGTLAHGLVHLYNDLPGVAEGRAGLVHRLDKDTSGILLVAKDEQTLQTMMVAFKERLVKKSTMRCYCAAHKSHVAVLSRPWGDIRLFGRKWPLCSRAGSMRRPVGASRNAIPMAGAWQK